ncbi:MAG: ASKHA domain-containing protein [bacterium]|jgi:uncharacterized 2Fe-2S/4Fe-4S cluster protein (DUF4445 family)
MPYIYLPNGSKSLAPAGIAIAQALRMLGVDIWLPCGGNGYCGRCLIRVQGELEPLTTVEKKQLSPEEITQGYRLACQAKIIGDLKVFDYQSLSKSKILTKTSDLTFYEPQLPLIIKKEISLTPPTTNDQRSDLLRLQDALGKKYDISLRLLSNLPRIIREAEFQITVYLSATRVLDLKPGSGHNPPYGIAIDVGTTTMVAYLLNLEDKKCVATAATNNPQAEYGEDVISRILYASQQEGLDKLQNMVLDGANSLIQELIGATCISPEDIYQVILVGNTCMQHLFFGIDPSNLGLAPYIPASNSSVIVNAAQIGLGINPEAEVEFLSNIAGFVGSDALVGALLLNLGNRKGTTLFIDLGTNGEIILATGKEIVACSTAAGPAFEGAGIACGTRAVSGAIDRVEIDKGKIKLHVIDDCKFYRGICGSGLIDALAVMLELGILEPGGRICGPNDVISAYNDHITAGARGFDFYLDPNWTIKITQKDVRKVQLAKGAIAAGVKMLLAEIGLLPSDLDEVFLAGGFGNYLNVKNAQKLGLIPQIAPERVKYVGNAAGAGAQLVLLSQQKREEAVLLAKNIKHLELAGKPSFSNIFMEAMMFKPW